MKKLGMVAVLAAVGAMTGCASVEEMSPNPGLGLHITTTKSYEQVWAAAMKSIPMSHMDLMDYNKESGVIHAESGAQLAGIIINYGTYVSVWVQPAVAGATSYTINVQGMNKYKGQFIGSKADDQAFAVYSALQQQL